MQCDNSLIVVHVGRVGRAVRVKISGLWFLEVLKCKMEQDVVGMSTFRRRCRAPRYPQPLPTSRHVYFCLISPGFPIAAMLLVGSVL